MRQPENSYAALGMGQQSATKLTRCETCGCVVGSWGVLYQPEIRLCQCVRVQRIIDRSKWRD